MNEQYRSLHEAWVDLEELGDTLSELVSRAERASTRLKATIDAQFEQKRCESCRSGWMDSRAQPVVMKCPTCGHKVQEQQ